MSQTMAGTMKHRPLLSPVERDTWRSFIRVHAALTRRLDDDLRRDLGIGVSSIEVLWVLAAEPGNRMRMTDIADHLVFTRSGVTRLVDRLERDGYVTRCEADEDLRGRYTILTRKGFDLFEEAAALHVDGLRELFFSQLGGDLAEFACLLERVEAGLGLGPEPAYAPEGEDGERDEGDERDVGRDRNRAALDRRRALRRPAADALA
ncbi:MAG: MarR family transcriptional regulator [Actinobacteria bacterium]|nr:MarR family transcriptional regulator [Actinomycetota bacterium]